MHYSWRESSATRNRRMSNFPPSLHVNLEKLVAVNYSSLIGTKRVSKIKGLRAEDANARAAECKWTSSTSREIRLAIPNSAMYHKVVIFDAFMKTSS